METENNQNASLSSHDKAILNKIFNPSLPFNDVLQEELISNANEEETEEVKQSKAFEIDSVKAAEKGDLANAMDLMNKAVQLTPNRASCYNNRAQVFQLSSNIDGAIEDLNKAIELSISEGNVACQAFTQRGIIYKFKGRDEEARADFQAAADLGGEFAKQQLIAMNPYAAMCNQMMSEVIRKVKKGEM